MKLIVAGGRAYSNWQHVYATLDRVHAKRPISVLIQGGCSGADHIAAMWGDERGIRVEYFHADWDKHGKAAGPIRNREMAKVGEGLVAFEGGAGTADMIRAAEEAGLKVMRA